MGVVFALFGRHRIRDPSTLGLRSFSGLFFFFLSFSSEGRCSFPVSSSLLNGVEGFGWLVGCGGVLVVQLLNFSRFSSLAFFFSSILGLGGVGSSLLVLCLYADRNLCFLLFRFLKSMNDH